jgi:integrase
LTTGSVCRATNWNQLVRELGYPGLRRHDLRHTGATWYANAGVPLHVVSDILGHASVETTKSHLHTSDAALYHAAQRVESNFVYALKMTASALDSERSG